MSCSGAVFAFFPCTESVGIFLTFTKKTPNPCRLCWVPAGWRWPSCRGGHSVAWQFLQLKHYQVTLFPENPRQPHPAAKEGFSRSTTLRQNVCTRKEVSCDLSGRPWPTCNASMSSLLKVGVVTAPQGPGPPPAAAGRATPTTSALQPCSSGFLIGPGIISCGRLKQCT